MKFIYIISALTIVGLVLTGCSDIALEPDDRGKGPERGLGKADGPYSCKDNCGGMAPGGCWCDDKCSLPENNDCCVDKVLICDGQPGSCQGHCGGKSPDGCWCDTACSKPENDDCCADKKQVCDQTTTTCTSNSNCKSGEYCHFNDGDCLLPTFNILQGSCKAKPQACTYLYDPVCGCDGKDYSNSCLAHEAGTSVAKKGSCNNPPPPPPPTECEDKGGYCAVWGGLGPVCKSGYSPASSSHGCGAGTGNVADDLCCLPDAPDPCWGAWIDQFGGCRGPADGVLPASCCEDKCMAINKTYAAAVKAAKSCSPFVLAMQCYDKVDDDLICPCSTYINKPPSYTPIAQAAQEFKQEGCDKLTFACPAVMCPAPTGGVCDINTSTCQDVVP